MGRQIIKQPNGKYCIFSSIVDNITHYDATEEEIIDMWANEEKILIAERVGNSIKKLDNGENPYGQFTQTFDETIDLIREIHGDATADELKREIK